MNDLITATYEAAAQERGQKAPSRAARPSQRRNAETSTNPARGRGTLHAVEIRDSSTAGAIDFHGVASVTERGYEMYDFAGPYTEIVNGGAFTETLKQDGLDVPLVLNHESLRRIARTTLGTLTLTETGDGLDVRAPELDAGDPDVAYIVPKLRSGLVDEMSFMFQITSGQWSPDWTEYRIQAVNIHRGDVSIVGYGASPFTSAALRQARALTDPEKTQIAVALGQMTAASDVAEDALEAMCALLGMPMPDMADAAAGAVEMSAPKTPVRSSITDDDVRVRSLRTL